MRIGLIGAAGDVDTASATLRMDDGTLAVVSCGRYNEAFYVAEACELSRHRHQPVPVAEVRR